MAAFGMDPSSIRLLFNQSVDPEGYSSCLKDNILEAVFRRWYQLEGGTSSEMDQRLWLLKFNIYIQPHYGTGLATNTDHCP